RQGLLSDQKQGCCAPAVQPMRAFRAILGGVPKQLRNQPDGSGWEHQNATWLMETPQILEAVQRLDAEWLDRGAVEWLFRVKRRQALYLMAKMAARRFGSAWLVQRASIIETLKSILDSPGFQSQLNRRQMLEQALTAERSREVPIEV